ncbi:MAG: hypothetical protein ACPGYV_03480 [Phycisphaeraceae bacterium]
MRIASVLFRVLGVLVAALAVVAWLFALDAFDRANAATGWHGLPALFSGGVAWLAAIVSSILSLVFISLGLAIGWWYHRRNEKRDVA